MIVDCGVGLSHITICIMSRFYLIIIKLGITPVLIACKTLTNSSCGLTLLSFSSLVILWSLLPSAPSPSPPSCYHLHTYNIVVKRVSCKVVKYTNHENDLKQCKYCIMMYTVNFIKRGLKARLQTTEILKQFLNEPR